MHSLRHSWGVPQAWTLSSCQGNLVNVGPKRYFHCLSYKHTDTVISIKRETKVKHLSYLKCRMCLGDQLTITRGGFVMGDILYSGQIFNMVRVLASFSG